MTAVSAAAFDEMGLAIPIAQQPSYVGNLRGYQGWLNASDLVGKRFVALVLTPVLAGGIPLAWAPMKSVDTNINQGLQAALNAIQAAIAQIQATVSAPGEGGATYGQ